MRSFLLWYEHSLWTSGFWKQSLIIGFGFSLAFWLRRDNLEDITSTGIVILPIAVAMVLTGVTVLDWMRYDGNLFMIKYWFSYEKGLLKALISFMVGLLFLASMLVLQMFGNDVLSWQASILEYFFPPTDDAISEFSSYSSDGLNIGSVLILISLVSVLVLTVGWLSINVGKSWAYLHNTKVRYPVISLEHHWGGFGRGVSGINASTSLVMLILTVTIGLASIGTIYGVKRKPDIIDTECSNSEKCSIVTDSDNRISLNDVRVISRLIADAIATSQPDQPDVEAIVKVVIDGVTKAMPKPVDTASVTSNVTNIIKTELPSLINKSLDSYTSKKNFSDNFIQLSYLFGEIARLQQFADEKTVRQQNDYVQELGHITHLLTLQKSLGVNMEFRSSVASSIEQAFTNIRNSQKSRFYHAPIRTERFSITQFDVGFIHNSSNRKRWIDTSAAWVNDNIIKVLVSEENKGESGLKVHHAFIWGQTDKSGGQEENLHLSKRRILSVFNEICAFSNVTEDQAIKFYGLAFGEEIAKSEYEHNEKTINVTLVVGPASQVPPDYIPEPSRIQVVWSLPSERNANGAAVDQMSGGNEIYECGSDHLQQVLLEDTGG